MYAKKQQNFTLTLNKPNQQCVQQFREKSIHVRFGPDIRYVIFLRTSLPVIGVRQKTAASTIQSVRN